MSEVKGNIRDEPRFDVEVEGLNVVVRTKSQE